MKYKVGDKVRIKGHDWYKEQDGLIPSWLYPCCGRVMTITVAYIQGYAVEEVQGVLFKDFMIEGLVEEESEKKLSDESWRYKNIFDHSQYPQSFECPEGYIFKDENGNVINATKIVLEKKKKEYPKTYEECCKVLNFCGEYFFTTYDEGIHFPENDNIVKIHQILKSTSILIKLLICRDTYWKIAGEEMGLGRSWEPNDSSGYCTYAILRHTGHIRKSSPYANSELLEFPTKEMRDAFYENFKELIEICKELL